MKGTGQVVITTKKPGKEGEVDVIELDCSEGFLVLAFPEGSGTNPMTVMALEGMALEVAMAAALASFGNRMTEAQQFRAAMLACTIMEEGGMSTHKVDGGLLKPEEGPDVP